MLHDRIDPSLPDIHETDDEGRGGDRIVALVAAIFMLAVAAIAIVLIQAVLP